MHPLQQTLDTSQHEFRHEGPVKRRTSLDNSCLSAHESMRMLLPDPESYERSTRQPRRYSLTHELTITATFMASDKTDKQKDVLDLDCHNSNHSRTTVSIEGLPPMEQQGDEELSEDDLFDNSDYDSFCDASVQEQANKEYLIKDLGASCFWGGEASISDFHHLDGSVGNLSMPNHRSAALNRSELCMPDVIEEEGHASEQAQPASPVRRVLRVPKGRSPAKKVVRKVKG